MLNALKHRLRGFLAREHGLILTYHSIQTQPLPFPVWHHLDAARFEAHIAYLARHFRCVPLSVLLDEMTAGRIAPYTVALTFDDGYRDNLTVALPILQRFRVPATLFLTTGFVGGTQLLWPEQVACTLALTKMPILEFVNVRYALAGNAQKGIAYRQLARVFKNTPPDDIPERLATLLQCAEVTAEQLRASAWHRNLQPLDWNEVQILRGSGLFEFGAHTLTHRRLSALPDAEAEREIAAPKQILENHVGPVQYFAYPHGSTGDYTDEHRAMAVRAGYCAVFTADTQTVTSRTDPYAVPRAGVGAETTQDEFAYLVHGGAARANAVVDRGPPARQN